MVTADRREGETYGSRLTTSRWLDDRAALFAERPMLCDEVRQISYENGVGAIRACAARLREAGIEPGDHVALHAGISAEHVAMFLALVGYGAVVVNSNILYAPDETRHVLEHGRAVAVIAGQEHLENEGFVAVAEEGGRKLLDLGELVRFDDEAEDWPPGSGASADADASVLFTSGSTGRPKGVVYKQASFPWAGEVIASAFRLTANDMTLCCVPLFHMNGQMCHMAPTIHAGAGLFLAERFSASAFWPTIRRHGITYSSLPATAVRILLTAPEEATDADNPLTRILLGLSLTEAQQREFENRYGVRLLEAYGLTEGVCIAAINPYSGRTKVRSGGLPATGYSLRIVGEDGQEVEPGAVGEIELNCISRNGLFDRYLDDPEATAAAFRDGWLRTGDLGKLDEDGYLFFFSRAKDMIKRSGHNISAAEVERVLQEHDRVREVAVIGVPDPIRDEAVKAFLVLTPGDPVETEELRAYCAERLAAFKVPSFFEFADDLPRTPGGKINKSKLTKEAEGG